MHELIVKAQKRYKNFIKNVIQKSIVSLRLCYSLSIKPTYFLRHIMRIQQLGIAVPHHFSKCVSLRFADVSQLTSSLEAPFAFVRIVWEKIGWSSIRLTKTLQNANNTLSLLAQLYHWIAQILGLVLCEVNLYEITSSASFNFVTLQGSKILPRQ